MSYQIVITKSALKELTKMPTSVYKNMDKRISGLAFNPFPDGYTKLKGSENSYRIRVGAYRIIYNLYHDELVIKIIKVGHRSDVYKYGR